MSFWVAELCKKKKEKKKKVLSFKIHLFSHFNISKIETIGLFQLFLPLSRRKRRRRQHVTAIIRSSTNLVVNPDGRTGQLKSMDILVKKKKTNKTKIKTKPFKHRLHKKYES